MNWTKRITALLLCLLLLGSSAVSAFAQTDVITDMAGETVAPTEAEETAAPTEVEETAAPTEEETTPPAATEEATEPAETEETTVPTETEEPTQPAEEDATAPAETEPSTRQDLAATTSGGHSLTVSGNLPVGTLLVAEDAALADCGAFQIEDADRVEAVLDISLEDADGGDYQPYEADETVRVTLDVTSMGLVDGTIVRVSHLHEGAVTVIEPLVVKNGKLVFSTDSFSLYLVESLGVTEGIEITAGAVYTMTVGQEQVFYCNDTDPLWVVEDRHGVITYTTMPQSDDQTKLPWIKVRAEKAGSAIIFVEKGGSESNPSLTITVVEKEGFHIENKVAESGCLIPVWQGNLSPDDVTYTWLRSDGIAVVDAAKNTDGSVNISTDRGGVTNGSRPVTYTVTATDAAGNVLGTDSYEITYGNEILNPSFEYPVGTGSYWYKPNGTPGMYWKTTSPGIHHSQAYLGCDIEFARGDDNPYEIGAAANGDQFVELNAESFGTLYQDILTTSGSQLDWAFSHTSRSDEECKMYVVIAPTQYAQEVINLSDIKAMLASAGVTGSGSSHIPTGGAGYEFTHHGGTYRIWTDTSYLSAQTPAQWNQVSGRYTVPEGQYLSRLFFVSDPYASSPDAMIRGNIIDGVYAGEHMSYRVEYYKEGQLQENHTEGSNYAAAYHAVELQNLSVYLEEYANAHRILLNGNPYPGTLEDLLQGGLYIAGYSQKPDDMEQKEDIVLQIYFQEVDIVVTKEFVIEGWEELSEEEKASLTGDGLTAVFGLYEGEEKISETAVTVYSAGATGQLTAQAAFEDVDTDYYGRTFTVKEESVPTLEGYDLKSQTAPQTFTLVNEPGQRIQVVRFTNVYDLKPVLFDLTIRKTGCDAVDENQAFLFRITGAGGFTLDVTVTGNGAVTVRNLLEGEYTVTELTDWSWRYEPEANSVRISHEDAVDGRAETVFSNRCTEEKWLSGDSLCENWWGGENGAAVVKRKTRG